jgi:hypothetical protein
MTLKAQLTTDLSVFFDTNEFAETVTYNAAPIIGIPDYGADQDSNDSDSMTKATIFVKASDVPAPKYRDTVIINSIVWNVLNITEGDGYVWKLNLYRDERPHL